MPTLELSMKDINTILISLETVQWKIANPLIMNIHAQIRVQDKKAEEAKKAEEELKKKAKVAEATKQSQVGKKGGKKK